MAALACCIAVAACASGPRSSPPRPPLHTPILASSYILAPVRGDAMLELEDLQGVRGNAAQLRRSFILLHSGKPREAVDAAAEVVYGVERPSPAEEAYARYIRAESYAAMGEPSRGNFDRARARELALDPDLRRRLETAPEAVPVAAAAAALAGLQRRPSWNPSPVVAARLDPMGRVFRATVHHSAMYFRDQSTGAALTQIQLIQRQHINGRAFGDIGYHYLIDPAGRVWEGREVRWQGAHAKDENNLGNVGICVLGNFVRGSEGQLPTEAQARSLRSLLTELMQKYRIGPDQVKTHRDFVNTECPGPLLQSVVDRFVADARAALLAGDRLAARE